MGRNPKHDKKAVLKALVDNDYQMSEVAKQLQVSRATAYGYLTMYQIEIKKEIFVKSQYNEKGCGK